MASVNHSKAGLSLAPGMKRAKYVPSTMPPQRKQQEAKQEQRRSVDAHRATPQGRDPGKYLDRGRPCDSPAGGRDEGHR